MKFQTVLAAAVALLLGSAVSASAQAVTLQFNNGNVTLSAQNAQLRTILDEWSRLGGTRFVNADRLGGAPVTLELTAVPERQALEILLRAVAGYVVTQRDQTTGLSRLGGVVILPTSNAVRNPAPVTFGAATVQRPVVDDGRDDQDADFPQAGQRLPTPVNPFTATPGTTSTPGVIRVVTPATANAPFGSVTQTTPPGSPEPVRPPTVQTSPGGSRPGEISPQPQQPQQPSPSNQR
jgi:hypothetical protein